MTRNEAAAWIGARYGQYLTVVSRLATDTAGNLKDVIDDALRALGYATAQLPAAAPADEDAYTLQLAYRTMSQVHRDLAATSFDISSAGDSVRLSQRREGAEQDLKLTANAVLESFGTLGVVLADDGDVFAIIDTNVIIDDWVAV